MQNPRSRILVIEDTALVAMEMADALAAAGFDVLGPACSMDDALHYINSGGYDAAVLDVFIGNQTTAPFAAKLKESGIPFVIVSGYLPGSLPREFSGARALVKPADPAELIAEVSDAMKQKKSGA